MKTNKVVDFAKKVDAAIPDATTETVMAKGLGICKDATNTGMCLVATCMCAGKTLTDAAELGLMVSKTITKKAIIKTAEVFTERPLVTVYK